MSRSLPTIPDADLVPRTSRKADDDERGFGALRTEKGPLPLESMDVRGRIDGLLARVLVRQTFVNGSDEALEASYIFPMPDRAAVTRFRMMVAGREVEGVLEERGKARQHYDAAIAEGRRASIAEEDRPGVFNLRVGNLLPGERATIELTLCGVLPYADGEVTFRFPLVVAPRYIPGKALPGPSVGDGTALDTDAVPDASRISPPVLLPGFPNPVRLSLEVELHDGGAGADDVHSSLHAVREEEREGYRRIRIEPGERLDRDFILRFRLGGHAIRSTLSLHPDADDREQGTFALTIVPPAGPVETRSRPRDVVFVLDRSGSMAGWKMVAARRAMARMIDTLGEIDRFGVLLFDSVVETPRSLPDGLVPAGDRDRFRAVEYLATVEARGGTEMAEPLDRAVKRLAEAASPDRDRILVLVTDGQVGHEDQILSMLGDRLKGIRVFAIGIDRAVNEGFLRRLAERGGGSCELVESEDRLDEVMAAIHRRIGWPLLTGLGLDARGLAVEPGEVVPGRLPDLFPGSPLLILGRYRGRPQGSIAIRATGADGEPYSDAVPALVRENPAIAAAWARGQIRQLEDRYAAGDRDRSNLERAIVALSLRFQVLCRFTAYIAIDRSQVVNEGGSVHRITQPVEVPEGWGAARAMGAAAPRMMAGGGGGSRSRAQSGGMPSRFLREAHLDAMLSPPSPAAFAPADLPMPGPEDTAELSAPPPMVETLADRLRAEGPMPARRAAALVAELAAGLQRVHAQGLAHRSISPREIVLAGGGSPRLQSVPVRVDDPVSRTDPSTMAVSCYTPPERLRADAGPADPRGDLYALGVILYELLTGRRPFRDDRGPQVLRDEILRGAPTRPRKINRSIPSSLEEICLKAMAGEPSARFASGRELAEALLAFLNPRRKPFWK